MGVESTKGFLIADSVLDDHNRRVITNGGLQSRGDRFLIDCFMCADNVVEGASDFVGGSDHCLSLETWPTGSTAL